MSLLDDRFEILDEIGRGSQAVTYRAQDHETGEIVALKELDFRRVEDWKSQELFEREGKTLQGLQHDAIPSYVAAFAVEDDDSVRLFLAQEFVDGPTLADELKSGKRWTEKELVHDAKLLLDALCYLHDRHPPVIHRDIKPSNIIRRADGLLALVDFGAAQNVLPRTVGGSTVIGTPGYMPMEQLMGRAVPGTDLYALGATFVHLLTAIEPSSLPVERNRLQFEDKIGAGPLLKRILRRLTEPSVEDRYPDAHAVLRDLQRELEAETLNTNADSDSSGEFDRRESDWDSLHETVDDDSSGEMVRVDHGRRTMAFPRWTSVVPGENGEFFMEFETHDLDEHELRVMVVDTPNELHLQAWTSERAQLQAQRTLRWALVAAAVVLVGLCYGAAPGLVPLALVGAMCVVFWRMSAEEEITPDIELQLSWRRFVLDTNEFEFRLFPDATAGGTTTARFRLDGTQLVLSRDAARHRADPEAKGVREAPLISFSRNATYQATWLAKHLNARASEISAKGDNVELDFEADTDRGEFWKESPIAAETLPAHVRVED